MKNFQNAREDYVNKHTGEVFKRKQYREHIFLSEPELELLVRAVRKYNFDLNAIFDDVNDYIEINWNTEPMSYIYIKRWIDRNVEFGNTLYVIKEK